MKRSELAFLICVSLVSIGLTSWWTTNRLLRREEVAAQSVYDQRVNDSELARGLEKAPVLLKRMYLAAGEHEAAEFSILVCALGLVVGAIGIYIRQEEGKRNVQSGQQLHKQ